MERVLAKKFDTVDDWNDLIVWLRSHSVNVPSFVTIAEMDEVVLKFMRQNFTDEVVEEAKKLAEGEHKHDKKAPLYIKIMKKIQEKGVDYIAEEHARISNIQEESGLMPEKRALNQDKINILEEFNRCTEGYQPPEEEQSVFDELEGVRIINNAVESMS